MSRMTLLVLSAVACGFGVIALTADGDLRAIGYGFNFALATLLAVLTWQDLRQRGWTWQSAVVGLSYLAAPLVGLILYGIASTRPKRTPDPA